MAASDVDPWLLRVLGSFRALGYMGKELREARWQALELSMRATAPARSGSGSIVVGLIGELSGHEVSNVKEALIELCKGGRRGLASRVQTISKWRNRDAHPPIAKLLRDIRESFHSGTAAGASDVNSQIQKQTRPAEFFIGEASGDAAVQGTTSGPDVDGRSSSVSASTGSVACSLDKSGTIDGFPTSEAGDTTYEASVQVQTLVSFPPCCYVTAGWQPLVAMHTSESVVNLTTQHEREFTDMGSKRHLKVQVSDAADEGFIRTSLKPDAQHAPCDVLPQAGETALLEPRLMGPVADEDADTADSDIVVPLAFKQKWTDWQSQIQRWKKVQKDWKGKTTFICRSQA